MREDLELLRKGLWPLSLLYGLVVSVRNYLFDAGLRKVHAVGVPVVSVGNLAAGGTGKTPLVAWLVERAREVGLRPGVLARGYGRAAGEPLNDEGLLLARRFPNLCQVQDPDRVRGAKRLVEEMQVDLIIVDDGFQHRRLHRDWNLVCLDASRPFAGGLLPAGNLREYPKSLRRADAIFLTRAGGFDSDAVATRLDRLVEMTGRAPSVGAFATGHRATRLREMPGGRDAGLESLRGRRVMLLSGIARPRTFAELIESLGGEIVEHVRRRDHHRHTDAELREIGRRAESSGAALVTTEKDDAKLDACQVPRWVLELDLEFLTPAPEIGTDASTFLSFRGTIRP